jgi:hypothetical protein
MPFFAISMLMFLHIPNLKEARSHYISEVFLGYMLNELPPRHRSVRHFVPPQRRMTDDEVT